MKTEHVLLLSIALSIPALAAETKPPGNTGSKSRDQVTSKADVGQGNAASAEAMTNRPAKKNRVRQSFPPAAKRM